MRETGAVYTPTALSDFVAAKVAEFYLRDPSQQKLRRRSSSSSAIKILDPACGDGELLVSASTQLAGALGLIAHEDNHLADSGIALHGIDIDQRAVRRTRARLNALARGLPRVTSKVLVANALSPQNNRPIQKGWQQLLADFNAKDGFDIVIANPPWGARVPQSILDSLRGHLSLLQGQYDTSDLFIELSLSILKPNGYLAFIVPDSLFALERTPLRQMLLERTELQFVARLGERLFPKINRACAVIICKNARRASKAAVRCFRLTPSLRKQILSGAARFGDAERLHAHTVPQERFLRNPNFALDIDLAGPEESVLTAIGSTGKTFRDQLTSDRGVELGKNGRVCQCTSCGLWMAYPAADTFRCPHCRTSLDPKVVVSEKIVSADRQTGYMPLIVGQSVRRYGLGASLWIDPSKDGIKYKSTSVFAGPKLLVRKTGVGLSATVDYSAALTNQVVYIFRRNDNEYELPLEFFLGILNSRAMYFYLVKSHGELEWKSHPYVTQTQILNLPLPMLATPKDRSCALRLASLVQEQLQTKGIVSPIIDARIERLVAALFGLSDREYRTIYDTLAMAQGLLPVLALRRITIDQIFGDGHD
jgi:tRNA1(Val) A37 N6-methylase TrmN6